MSNSDQIPHFRYVILDTVGGGRRRPGSFGRPAPGRPAMVLLVMSIACDMRIGW